MPVTFLTACWLSRWLRCVLNLTFPSNSRLSGNNTRIVWYPANNDVFDPRSKMSWSLNIKNSA